MDNNSTKETDWQPPNTKEGSSPRLRRAEAFGRFGLELSGAEDLATVGCQIRDFCSELWEWDSFLFTVRRGSGSRHFRGVLEVDTIDGKKFEFAPQEFRRYGLTLVWSRLLDGESLLINRSGHEIKNSKDMFGDESRSSASLIYVPIISGEHVVGMLSIQSYSPNKFSDADCELLKHVAETVGPTVLRCRVEERMFSFLNLGERLNAIVDPADVGSAVANTSGHLLGWDFFSLHLYNCETKQLRLVTGLSQEKFDCRIMSESVTVLTDDDAVLTEVLNGEIVRMVTMSGTNAASSGGYGPFGKSLPLLASVIFSPIRSVDKVLGLLCLQSSVPAAFGAEEVDIIRGLTDYCSGALQRASAQQMLMQSEERHRLIVENVNDGIVISQNDRFEFFNRRFASMLGYSLEELRDKTYKDVYHEQGLEILEQRVKARKAGLSVPERYETLFYKRDGTVLPVEANVRVISDYKGGLATFAVIRDITERRQAAEKIFRSDARYKALLDGSEDYIFVLDRDLRFVHVNCVVEKRFGIPPEERIGKTVWDLYRNKEVPDFISRIQSVFETGKSVTYDDDNVVSGIWICTETIISPIFSQSGEVESVLGVSRDVTSRRQAALELEKSEQRYAIAVRGANDGIWDWNLETAGMYFSPRWWAIVGEDESKSSMESYPAEWFDRICADDLVLLKEKIFDHIQGRTPHLEDEHRIRHADGTYRWVLCRGLCVRDSTGTAVRMGGSLSDITARKDAEEKLHYGANHDALTGLPNRCSFLDNLSRCMHRSRRRTDHCGPFAVLFLDLDRFKVINDSLGHLAGDELICTMARRLEKCVRPGDTVARMGGDEFTILLEELRQDSDVTRVADRIIRELGNPVEIRGFPVQVTVSMGIAFDKPSYHQPDDLLRDADTAMYRAKENGRNGYQVFDQAMHKSVMAQLKSERDLRRAVARQEFVMHYQPIYAVANRQLVGFEALLRWNHVKRGLVPPNEFIPLAEETGLIIPMGWWIISEATRASLLWNKNRGDDDRLTVSINVSPKQFAQPKVISRINFLISNSGARPEDVILEITESLLMDEDVELSKLLQDMRSQGIRFALDDFGTGYSSLSFLRRSELDIMKIDRTFVRDIGTSKSSREIVNAMLALARGLNLLVTAEGVETREQQVALAEMQCDRAQGYFYSKPLTLEQAVELALSEAGQFADPC